MDESSSSEFLKSPAKESKNGISAVDQAVNKLFPKPGLVREMANKLNIVVEELTSKDTAQGLWLTYNYCLGKSAAIMSGDVDTFNAGGLARANQEILTLLPNMFGGTEGPTLVFNPLDSQSTTSVKPSLKDTLASSETQLLVDRQKAADFMQIFTVKSAETGLTDLESPDLVEAYQYRQHRDLVNQLEEKKKVQTQDAERVALDAAIRAVSANRDLTTTIDNFAYQATGGKTGCSDGRRVQLEMVVDKMTP